jgi:hypothetical protein
MLKTYLDAATLWLPTSLQPDIGLQGCWQGYCIACRMNDHAYDISYLLESEPARVEVPDLRVARAAAAKPPKPSVADAQEAMARELLQAAEAHEELIQQYLRFSSSTVQ